MPKSKSEIEPTSSKTSKIKTKTEISGGVDNFCERLLEKHLALKDEHNRNLVELGRVHSRNDDLIETNKKLINILDNFDTQNKSNQQKLSVKTFENQVLTFIAKRLFEMSCRDMQTRINNLDHQNENCSICLDPIGKEDETLAVTNCNHYFHQNCLTGHLDHAGNNCPNCRELIIVFNPGYFNKVKKKIVFIYQDDCFRSLAMNLVEHTGDLEEGSAFTITPPDNVHHHHHEIDEDEISSEYSDIESD